ncbi:hypothetical protein [Candidatus Methanoprimaticola sp. MG2]|uniref:hypothetical protein n=1 Tax=Candidatus Methanoprimaticola sp. MG2 TaxID=3228838 RepID=UPI0039C6FC4F
MNGFGSHCEGCEHLFVGMFGPFCCRGAEPVPILFVSSCPPSGAAAIRGSRRALQAGHCKDQTSLEAWA